MVPGNVGLVCMIDEPVHGPKYSFHFSRFRCELIYVTTQYDKVVYVEKKKFWCLLPFVITMVVLAFT